MKKLTLLMAAGTLWLFLAAFPVLADGGPHVAGSNNGLSSLTADSCAGCHRTHTAQGAKLLKTATEEELCFTCHGASSTGATTDVQSGIQYGLATGERDTGVIAGALRAGGFVDARIDSANPSRISYPFLAPTEFRTSFSMLVPALVDGAPVTSAHLDVDGAGGVVARDVVWGNGAIDSGAGPTATISCGTCHNPHGNGQYRILNPRPEADGADFVRVGEPGATVNDAELPSGSGAAGTRNYTVQNGRTLQDVVTAALGPTAGDYWRKWLPWDGVPTWNGFEDEAGTGVPGDIPMYVVGAPDNLVTFNVEIEAWCSTCHSRYHATSSDITTPSGDSIYTYRHLTQTVACTQCHVSHGSNATMIGNSGAMDYPDGSAPTTVGTGPTTTYLNSRLLKIDNRGTCQACHDPTNTIPYTGNFRNP